MEAPPPCRGGWQRRWRRGRCPDLRRGDVDIVVVVVASAAAHTPPKYTRVIAGGNRHLRMFADGALVEGELVLDQVHGKEEYGAEIDQDAYAWRGQASREYHDDGEQNALWEMGLFFMDTLPLWDQGHK